MSNMGFEVNVNRKKDGSLEEAEAFLRCVEIAISMLEKARELVEREIHEHHFNMVVKVVQSHPGVGVSDMVKAMGPHVSNPELLELLQEAEIQGLIYRYIDGPVNGAVWYSL